MKLLVASFRSSSLAILSMLLMGVKAASADSVYRVGVIAPLSGPLAEYGQAARNGIELARSERPELFRYIEFLFQDSRWEAKTAVASFQHLGDIAKVSLVYNWGNPTSEAVAPLAESLELPLLAMSLDPAVARGRHFVIRSTNAAADFSALLTRYLQRKGAQRVGVVLSENTYVEGLYEGMLRSVPEAMELSIVGRYPLGEQDFRSTITKLRTRGYDYVGVFLISGQVANFYNQMADQRVDVPTFGTDFFESSTEFRLARGGMSGSVYPHLGVSDQFRKNYVQRFQNDYQIAYAGNAYDMAIVIGTRFGEVRGALPASEVMQRLRAVRREAGVGGTFSFVDTPHDGPHFHFPIQLKQIVGDTIQVIEP